MQVSLFFEKGSFLALLCLLPIRMLRFGIKGNRSLFQDKSPEEAEQVPRNHKGEHRAANAFSKRQPSEPFRKSAEP
ncbi:hypothetical protein D3C73_1614300 [compost metagenome]